MSNEHPLVNKEYLLEKFLGKGGWTYARIPEILQNKHAHFGWVRVRGTIDDYEIKGYNLMPMGNGQLFLPVKAAIRKKIGKQEGDYIKVILYADNLPTELPEELRLILADEPEVYQKFLSQSLSEQRNIIEWIYAAKTDDKRVERIVQILRQFSAD
jgi:hypothetical protein